MKIVVFLLISLGTLVSFTTNDNALYQDVPKVQKAAFDVLVKKCNVCHSTEIPKRVYTLENMNKSAKKINRQVFIRKKMPKGDDIRLTVEEKVILKNWINSLKG